MKTIFGVQFAMQETYIQSLVQEGSLEEDMAIYSSIPVWRIIWTEESARLQSMVSQRVGHKWATNTFTFHLLTVEHLSFSDKLIWKTWHPLKKNSWCFSWRTDHYGDGIDVYIHILNTDDKHWSYHMRNLTNNIGYDNMGREFKKMLCHYYLRLPHLKFFNDTIILPSL